MMVNWHRPPKPDPHGQARPDWLPRPTCKISLVCGPPGSGKSTLVAERAAPHDLIVDLDEIRSQLTNSALYEATDDGLGRALHERNRLLGDLARQPAWRRVWVIVSAPGEARRWWQDKLNAAEVILLDVPAEECIKRIRHDSRRARVRDQHIQAVADWWAAEALIR
jgi:shikimate kinase